METAAPFFGFGFGSAVDNCDFHRYVSVAWHRSGKLIFQTHHSSEAMLVHGDCIC